MLANVGSLTERRSGRSGTAAATIHALMREEILSLRRAPGSQISEKGIAAAHGVSRTPVREALLRLADEGLVDIVSKSGTYVSRIPISALGEAIAIRKVLEQFAVRAAVVHATRSQVMEMRAIVARMQEAAEADDQDQFHRADEGFHEAIAITGRHPGVWALVRQVKLQVDRFRRLTLPLQGRMLLAVAEHAAILDAIEARDAETAAERLGAHIDRLTLNLGDLNLFNPDFFIDDRAHPKGVRT
ncbi:GntR family transcriptional regulator [Phreatobacter sp.]|uniref:GntR family transcriptional regulator n=1 Tax=Phreatobacter sp. TaxID=1966341 RepID=UPI003F7126F8